MSYTASLPWLLANSLRGLELAHELNGAGNAEMPSLDLWANLLRRIHADEVARCELPAQMRLSKRAIKTRVATAARRGWIEQIQVGRGGGTIRLTPLGASVRNRWKSLELVAERDWYAKVGKERARRLRSSLESVVAIFPLEHPHYPASYGPADASVTGCNGRDWKAVLRGSGDTVSDIPSSALVSQAIVAFAIDYELLSPVALPLCTGIMLRIPIDGLPVREIDNLVGLSALVRHGLLCITASNGYEIASLTHRGKAVCDLFETRIRKVEAQWCAKFGDHLAVLRQALQSLPLSSENGGV